MNVITAIGNPILNRELREENQINILTNDLQYQDAIVEYLENNIDVDYIILSDILPGNKSIKNISNEVFNINKNIKIIIIVSAKNKNIDDLLMENNIKKIFVNNKTSVEEIVQYIILSSKREKFLTKENIKLSEKLNSKNNLETDTIEKKLIVKSKIKDNRINKRNIENNKIVNNDIFKNKIFNKKNSQFNSVHKNNKNNIKNIQKAQEEKNIQAVGGCCNIISILGNSGSGKSIFTVLFAKTTKINGKVLILDFDILNNSVRTILGIKKCNNKKTSYDDNYKKYITKVDEKIDILSGIDIMFNKEKLSKNDLSNIINKLKKEYNYIVIDTSCECFFEYNKSLIEVSDYSIFLLEANLLEIKKAKRWLEIYTKQWNIEEKKIKIVINKYNHNSVDINILKHIFSDFKIIGILKNYDFYNKIINKNYRCKINNNFQKEYNQIINKNLDKNINKNIKENININKKLDRNLHKNLNQNLNNNINSNLKSKGLKEKILSKNKLTEIWKNGNNKKRMWINENFGRTIRFRK